MTFLLPYKNGAQLGHSFVQNSEKLSFKNRVNYCMQGFVCDAHRVSDRVEKVAQLQTEKTIIETNDSRSEVCP